MKFFYLFFAVMIFLLVKADKTHALCSPRRKEFSLKFTDSFLVGQAVGSFVAIDEIDCQFNCHAVTLCDVYNFNPKTGQCILLDGRSSFKAEIQKDWIFKAQKCELNPCKNNGICYYTNSGPRCLCTCVWKGELCGVPTRNDNVLFFPAGSTKDYVLYENPITTSISAVTISVWLQVEDSSQEPTVMSYSTHSSPNMLSLGLARNYLSLIVIDSVEMNVIGQHQLVTDGQWHHLCVTWENNSGNCKLYVDGVKKSEENGIAVGAVIAQGALVLGQEQDSYIGGFQQIQSFQGNFTNLNLWDRVLTAAEVLALFGNCPTQEGNFIQWTQLMNSPKQGNVKLICTPFCNP